jgi:AcrR family transcriptional regulator
VARSIPPERFAQLITAATNTFVARGYRLTQMADVAEALGVAKGTLYGYVESKEALFDAAVRYADGPVPPPETSALPLGTPPAGSTVQFVRERLVAEVAHLELAAAVARRRPPESARAEFENIVRDLYRRMAKNRRALKLVDRCAVDHPELAAVWFNEGREGQVTLLTSYLEQRAADGSMRVVPKVALAARMALECIALWAIHMPWDPSPHPLAEDQAEDAVVDLLVHAYCKESRR